MNIVRYYLDKQAFSDDLSYLYYRHKEKLLPYIGTINSLLQSDNYALHFLINVKSISDDEIQCACRRVAIAWMYGVGVDYEKCHMNPSRSYISYCSNQLAVIEIQFPDLSAVLISPNGDIIVDEGEIRLNGKSHYPEGWVARRIIDGKEGVYTSDGKLAIPFGVFDDIEMKTNTAVYKIRDNDEQWFLRFLFHVKDIAKTSEKELMGYPEDLEKSKSLSKDRGMLLISPENVIVQIFGPMNCRPEPALLSQVEKDLTTKLLPLTVEIIQIELDRRGDQKA